MSTPEETAKRIDAQREAVVEDATHRALWFARELREIHPNLELVFVPEHVQAMGLTPGRFHIKFRNDRGPDAYYPLYGDDGEFVEPHSGILEQLKQQNIANDRNLEDLIRWEADKEDARRKEQERWREEFAEECRLAMKAMVNPGYNFGYAGWTNKLGSQKA